MIGVRKPFNRKLYEENNRKSKEVLLDFLKTVYPDGDFSQFWGETFKHDAIVKVDGRTVKYEVERKRVWDCSGKWVSHWPTVDVAHRKCASDADYFCMVNRDYDTLLVAPMSAVQKSLAEEKANSEVSSGEYFFRVPVSKFVAFHKQGDKWVKV